MEHGAAGSEAGAGRGRMVVNFIAFQAGWFACALTAGAGWPMLGTLVVAGLVGLHLFVAEDRVGEAWLIGVVAVLGGAIDTAQWGMGVSIGPVEALPAELAPVWFAGMYANFATTLRASLAWLGKRMWLAAAFGATGGPSTYWAGAGFGAIELMSPEWRSLVVLAVVWGVLTPALFVLEARMRGGGTGKSEG